MTNTHPEQQSASAPDPSHPSPPKARLRTLREHLSLAVQLVLSVAIAGGVLAYLVYGSRRLPRRTTKNVPAGRRKSCRLSAQG